MKQFDVISIKGAVVLARGELFDGLTIAELERRILSRKAFMAPAKSEANTGAEAKTSAPTESRPAGRPPKQRNY